MTYHAVPITKKDADAFVAEHHRHHNAAYLTIFNVAAYLGDRLVGVAQCARPNARCLCDGYTIEVKRLCTLGDRNCCSFLYAKCARIAKELGYRHIITYIYETEPGTSLLAAGWVHEYDTKPKSWDRPKRPRPTCVELPLIPKKRYGRML
jgi:hypothetical protein